jgi:uncharacterized membrane protein
VLPLQGERPKVQGTPDDVRGERRLPVTLTVLVAMALPFLLPERLNLGPTWLIPLLAGLLLIALAIGDPGRIDRRSAGLRALRIGLVALLIAQAAWSTSHLVIDLVKGGPETNDATVLLVTGAVIWVGNNIAFALLYWELDCGGPAARAHGMPKYPDLAFPGELNPQVVPPDWRPVFVDYLYLSLTNALAFSPTDVMPLKHWAKLSMALQSIVSVALLGLIIARAVNVLT